MSVTRSVESSLLLPVESVVQEALTQLGLPTHDEGRHLLLEALACRLAGTSVRELWEYDSRDTCGIDDRILAPWVERLSAEIGRLPYHAALALCTLAQPRIEHSDKRSTGAYYTDFRLAQLIADRVSGRLREGATVLDASSGTGILLVACALGVCGTDRTRLGTFLRNQVFAGDISSAALRGARIAMLSLLNDLAVLDTLDRHLRQGDSLDGGPTAWLDLAPNGFDSVVGNPPWEKLTLTRHEYLKANGHARHYGADYDSDSSEQFGEARMKIQSRANRLGSAYARAAGGELDLYRAFLDLALDLAKTDGHISMLVPAGLIRSRSCVSLRDELLGRKGALRCSVSDNRARYFAIDSRFKFIVLDWDGRSRSGPVRIETLREKDLRVHVEGGTTLGRAELAKLSIGLGVPEVRDDDERGVLRKMLVAGRSMEDTSSRWNAPIVRELDMSRHKSLFRSCPDASSLPLVEGRMVNHFRHNAKTYVSGTGRRAVWIPAAPDDACMRPQYWVNPDDLPTPIASRAKTSRVGFCDITGQTNERAMLAARIPAGAVCGNKVPTIVFSEEGAVNDDLADLWLGIVNSLPFDWFLRRVITTTVNFFILRSIPLPDVEPDSILGRRIIANVRALNSDDRGSNEAAGWARGRLRSDLDLLSLRAYGLNEGDLDTILRDFPLLDRRQPPIPGESRSTVTRDVLRSAILADTAAKADSDIRVEMARRVGAIPYVPAEFAGLKTSAIAAVGGFECQM